MITLYHAGGARDFCVLDVAVTPERWSAILSATKRLLALRGDTLAVSLLEASDFELCEGANTFNDEFHLLCAYVPAEQYVRAEKQARSEQEKSAFRHLAETVGEVSGFFVRFVAVSMDMSSLTGPAAVARPKLEHISSTAERALVESENALKTSGPTAAVDRAHTAIHAFLKDICVTSGIMLRDDASITDALAALRRHHPAFDLNRPHAQSVLATLRAIQKVLEALNRIRNTATLVHPNQELLDNPDAMLMINCARTLLHYVDARLQKPSVEPE